GYRRPVGDQSQDRGYLPGQPDAETKHSRLGGPGQVRHRAQPYAVISPSVGTPPFALCRLCSRWYRSKAPIKLRRADLRAYRRARARRWASSGGLPVRRQGSLTRCLAVVDRASGLFLYRVSFANLDQGKLVKARKSKMCHYFGHFYLTIIVTSRTLARPMRSMKANQIAVSQGHRYRRLPRDRA